ncbi:tyrosine-type recombinase/integrase [Trichocoleus desertorum GB2-A4]|uniref:Tyrosine-type recombinase/integrase n=1 Tax=Trichocoleus desertorum GB2-A4 TaxID=2933944 RepID=A0ABV0JF19_9CYAN
MRETCDRLGLVGVSTHSFRRTALTQMSSAGVPLRVIQEISGHRSLQALQRYLEVSELQLEGAIASLSF